MSKSLIANVQSPVRLGWLDGLRGWAVIMVVGVHVMFKIREGVEQGVSLTPNIDIWNKLLFFQWGMWGVQLFYTISGFTLCYMWHIYKQFPPPTKYGIFLSAVYVVLPQ